jgi:hypothetical protein
MKVLAILRCKGEIEVIRTDQHGRVIYGYWFPRIECYRAAVANRVRKLFGYPPVPIITIDYPNWSRMAYDAHASGGMISEPYLTEFKERLHDKLSY